MIFYEDFKTGTLTPVYGYGSSLHAAEWNAEPGRKTKTKLKLKKSGVQSPFSEYSSGGGSGASAIEMLQDLLNRYSQVLRFSYDFHR